MPIAFVISNEEEEVVNELSAGKGGDTYPHMDGSLFKFTRKGVKRYMAALAKYVAEAEPVKRNAATRLLERLATWIGHNQVRAHDPQLDLFAGKAPESKQPVVDLEEMFAASSPVEASSE